MSVTSMWRGGRGIILLITADGLLLWVVVLLDNREE